MSGAPPELGLGYDGEASPGLGSPLVDLGALGTPSEPGTPEGMRMNPALMPFDFWDWKTDAPEFVPALGLPFQAAPGASADAGPAGAAAGGVQMRPLSPGECHGTLIGPSIWTMVTPGPWGALAVPVGGHAGSGSVGVPAGAARSCQEDEEVQQLRAHYEWQVRRQDEELEALQGRLAALERSRAGVKERWEREREGLVREIARYRSALVRNSVPVEEFRDGVAGGVLASIPAAERPPVARGAPAPRGGDPWDHAAAQAALDASIDAKMRRLNGLLLDNTGGKRQADLPPVPTAAAAERGPTAAATAELVDAVADDMPLGASSIASTLQAMFPHATVRTQAPDSERENEGGRGRAGGGAPAQAAAGGAGEPARTTPRSGGGAAVAALASRGGSEAGPSYDDTKISELAQSLESSTGSQIDDRALKALQQLPVAVARDVLLKVDDLVRFQGGSCRNLSSILQSMCRKYERRLAGRDHAADDGDRGRGAAASGSAPRAAAEAPSVATPSRQRRAHDGDAACAFGSEGSGSPDEAVLAPSRARRPPAGDADDAEAAEDPGGDRTSTRGVPDHWTAARIGRSAWRRFSMKHAGDRWRLKLLMNGLDPPLTEAGMELYCEWLRERLAEFKEEHGALALRRCHGEVDFSSSGLGNQALWALLKTLAHYEVNIAILKLYKNRISEDGVLALCEFIKNNRRAGAIREIHLSHNELSEEAVCELLRTLHGQKSRYPPRRPADDSEGGEFVPVWIRLNNNRVREPAALVRSLQAEGIMTCPGRSTHGCSPTKCTRPECPLVHLYLFGDQDPAGGSGGADGSAACSPGGRRGRRAGRGGEEAAGHWGS